MAAWEHHRGRTALRLGPWVVGAWLAAGVPEGQATEPAGGESAAAPEDIGELWQQAQARMDTADYGDAIELLTRVYDAIALDPEAAALRSRVQWALHRAHLGAYGVDGEAQHLYVARDLLGKYREALPSGEATRQAEAEAAQAEVQERIAEYEASRPEPVVQPEPEPEPVVQPEPEPRPEPVLTPTPSLPPARPLIIAGAVTAGLGAVGLGVMAGGLGMANAAVDRFRTDPEGRAQARADIRRGNTIAVAGAAVGGALLVSGAVTLGLGLRRRSIRSEWTAGPGQAGLSWRVEF